jgi:hypothetical protein
LRKKKSFTEGPSVLTYRLFLNTAWQCATALALIITLFSGPANGADSLIYLEAQGVAGYSSRENETRFYSHMPEDAMQKPSVGIDFLQRFSGGAGDFGAFALQYRLAYDEADHRMEHQIYNAYFKYKASWSDLWVGHNRPAMGLSSYLDGHGLLLQTLPMNGFGFDRDWGIGSFKDFTWGNISCSLTNGAGMPARFNGNYLAAARISKGFLNQDNYSLGASAGIGETLMTMGYDVIEDDPVTLALAGVDAAYIWNQFEIRLDILMGENRGEHAGAVFFRGGINLLDEGRLKLELQPVYLKNGNAENAVISTAASFQTTADVSIKTMHQYNRDEKDHRIVLQVYLYQKM